MRAIVKKCHQQATEVLADYRPLMDSLVDVLIDKETIDGEEFRELVDKYIAENGKTPRPKAAEPVAV
jgi:cell division protease FtsH